MTIEKILPLLRKVKKTGNNRYLACCPAHDDRSPSMAVSEVDGGRVLIHCFAGCSTYDIVSAVGLELHDLFPPCDDRLKTYEPMQIHARDALEAVSHEITVLGVGCADMMKGKPLEPVDYQRMLKAMNRIQIAKDMVCR